MSWPAEWLGFELNGHPGWLFEAADIGVMTTGSFTEPALLGFEVLPWYEDHLQEGFLSAEQAIPLTRDAREFLAIAKAAK